MSLYLPTLEAPTHDLYGEPVEPQRDHEECIAAIRRHLSLTGWHRNGPHFMEHDRWRVDLSGDSATWKLHKWDDESRWLDVRDTADGDVESSPYGDALRELVAMLRFIDAEKWPQGWADPPQYGAAECACGRLHCEREEALW